jgi:phosphoribosylformylglycinamidine cyclo-ligase
MSKRRFVTYRDAGVDIDAGDEMVELIKPAVRSTFGPRVMGDLGGFAGLFSLNQRTGAGRADYKDPVLVGCTDGVGSKILLARDSGNLDTVGIDLVAMNVNDLICCGAEPLFFLDYVAVNRLDPKRVATIVEGIAAGCREAQCALLGGETAEMPDLYAKGDFDLAGFAVGVVERSRIIDGSGIKAGDVIVGLPASGIHSNGLALARRLAFKEAKLRYESIVPGIGAPIGDELLKPTRIYVRPVVSLLRRFRTKRVVRAMAHITGGGLPGNVVRVIPDGLRAEIDTRSWEVPAIFKFLQSVGVKREEMFRVFNMGIGLTMIVPAGNAKTVVGHFRRQGLDAVVIGKILKGRTDVALVG